MARALIASDFDAGHRRASMACCDRAHGAAIVVDVGDVAPGGRMNRSIVVDKNRGVDGCPLRSDCRQRRQCAGPMLAIGGGTSTTANGAAWGVAWFAR